jgi:Domain of unknown function (DUF4136)
MSIYLRTIGCLAFLFFFLPGNAQKVIADFNTNTDFNKFKTYAWLAPGDSVLNRPDPHKLFGGYVEKDANQELQSRGMKLVKDQPDAIFIFYTSVDEITKYSQSPTLSVGVAVGVGYPGYYGPAYYAGGSVPVAGGKVTASIEEDGMLGYSMYDTSTGKLVWSGSVEKTFKMSDDIAKIIADYTVKIFKKYPVNKKK